MMNRGVGLVSIQEGEGMCESSVCNNWEKNHARSGENTYGRVNREVLWQVLRMYYVSGELLIGNKCTYANSLA